MNQTEAPSPDLRGCPRGEITQKDGGPGSQRGARLTNKKGALFSSAYSPLKHLIGGSRHLLALMSHSRPAVTDTDSWADRPASVPVASVQMDGTGQPRGAL